MKHDYLHLTTLLAAILATPALAQHQHSNTASQVKPPAIVVSKTNTMPSISARPLTPLQRYQRFNADEPLSDWLSANNTVRDIGGWRVYAKEAAKTNQITTPTTVTNVEARK